MPKSKSTKARVVKALECRFHYLLAFALILTAATLHGAAQYDVYLLAGQSNMDGRGFAADLGEEQRKPSETVIIYYRNPPFSTEGWKPLAPGCSIKAGVNASLPSQTFGPEIGFARSMINNVAGHHLALIKGSKGATSLSKDWNPGVKGRPETQGLSYRNFLETIALATKALTDRGETFAIRGLLWHQGESDAESSKEAYQERLEAFIARIREDLGLQDLPVAVGEVYDNGKRHSVRAAQRAVAEAVPGVGFVSADGLITYDAGTHFDAASQLILGERFAKTIRGLMKH